MVVNTACVTMTEKDGGSVDATASAGNNGKSSSCSQEKAGGACILFEAERFKEAVEILESLEKDDPDDRKIKQNLAVARFYAGGAIEELYGTLNAISHAGNGSDDREDDEADDAVLSYNIAVVLYQRREFVAAVALLSRVYKVIEAIEEAIARRICLLLLDLYIMLYQPDNAVLVLQYLQRLAGVTNVSGQGKIGGISSGGDTRDDALSPTDDASGSVPRSDGVVTDGVATTQVPSSTLTDVMKFQLHQYRARLHIITRSLKACKREVKSALNLDNQSITALFLKSNFEYARRNYRKAIKLLSSCPTREPHVAGQSLAVMYYNNLAAVHLQMGKYALAELYCTKALAANEHEAGRTPPDDVSIEGSAAHNTHAPLRTKVADRLCELLYVRGLACLFQEQPERAFGFFKAALPQFSHNPRAWHRLAECCVQKHVLHVERIHKDGAGMFTHVGTALHRKTLVSSLDVPLSPPGDDAMSLSAAVMYLNNALALLHPESGVGSDGRTSSGASPSDTTEASDTRGGGGDNGSASSSNGESTHGGGGGGAAFGGGGGLMGEGGAVGVGAPSAAFALPGTCVSPVQDADVAVIRCHVLVNLAYAHLGTHNTYEALRYAQMVLAEESSLSVCPAGLKFLALLYSAECLIRQDRIPTAIQLLSPANIGDMLTSPATTGSRNTDVDDVGAEAEAGAAEERHQPVRALPAETAKATLLLNLAAAYCMSGACDQGAHCLAQVGTLQRGTAAYRQATLLSLFLALSRGQHDLAMDIIERSKLPEATVAQ